MYYVDYLLGIGPGVLTQCPTNGFAMEKFFGLNVRSDASQFMYVLVIVKTAVGPKAAPADVPEVPIAQSIRHPQLTPDWLDRFKPWLIVALLLVVLSYGPQPFDQIIHIDLNSPGTDFRPW